MGCLYTKYLIAIIKRIKDSKLFLISVKIRSTNTYISSFKAKGFQDDVNKTVYQGLLLMEQEMMSELIIA
jgi:hypothetical protein